MIHKNLCCKFITAVISVMLITATATAKSHTEKLRDEIKEQWKYDCEKYIFRCMPVSNFGVGTMYEAYTSDKVGKVIDDSVD